MGIFDFFRRSKKRDEEIIIEVPESIKRAREREELPASKMVWNGLQIMGADKLEEETNDYGEVGDEVSNSFVSDSSESVWGSNNVDENEDIVEIEKPSREDRKKWKEEATKSGNNGGMFNMFG